MLIAIGRTASLQHVQARIKPTRHSQMFWAGFSYNRRTSLYPMLGDPESPRGGVTGRRVLECLQYQLPTIAEPAINLPKIMLPHIRAV